MFDVVYYKDLRGIEPVADWVADPDTGNIHDSIDARITMLQNHGLDLPIRMLRPIDPRGKKEARVNGFYELRHRGKKWRIAVYHNLRKNYFVLLCAFRKSKDIQPQEIDQAYAVLYEYLGRENKIDVPVSYRRYN